MRFAGVERTIEQKTGQVRSELADKIDSEIRAFGDTGTALRQALSEAQMWNRDNFVRRDEFSQSIHQINRNIDALRASTESSMKTFDDKLDRLDQKLDAKLDKIIAKQG